MGASCQLPPRPSFPRKPYQNNCTSSLHLSCFPCRLGPSQRCSSCRCLASSLRLASAAGYDPLRRLPRLHLLHLVGCSPLPACLSSLASLAELRIKGPGQPLPPDSVGTIRAALPRLHGLTQLRLDDIAGLPGPPPELAWLTRLRTFAWSGPSHASEAAPAAMPSGYWLGSLCAIAAPAAVLAASLAMLGAAARLRDLDILGADDHPAATVSVLQWVQGRLTLQMLVVHTAAMPQSVVVAMMGLARCRPDSPWSSVSFARDSP
ncbi:hypothetical protein ABPG75_010704 [Micractinium tetrahymenae]